MDNMYKPYLLEEANSRIENILNMDLPNLTVSEILPTREELRIQTIRNSFASVVCVKFKVDIDEENKPLKIYRLIASEFYNILISHEGIRDVQVINDTFIALYDTPRKSDIDALLEMVAKINAVNCYFNSRLQTSDSVTEIIKIKIAMHYSHLSICRLGTSEESNGNIYYSGGAVSRTLDIVNEMFDKKSAIVFATNIFYENLKKDYKVFFEKIDNGDVYGASVVNTAINQWINQKEV